MATVNAAEGTTSELVATQRALIDERLAAYVATLRSIDTPVSLCDAIEWSLLAGGKRMRPLLVLAAAQTAGVSGVDDPRWSGLLDVACATELVHTYSLVHDDLPAMDDDDLRRGRATSHRQFGEATAILVGDALQASAFRMVADAPQLSPDCRVAAVSILARAAGPIGMVGGQYLDVAGLSGDAGADLLDQLHAMKTGALISAATLLGGVCANAEPSVLEALRTIGDRLGLIFQLVDDLLDETGDTASLGKSAGSDKRSGKVTAVTVHGGVDGVQQRIADEHQRVTAALNELPGDSTLLAQLAHRIAWRNA